ncbi:hypothetical protein EC973_006875 [Apophysomyces ossiformis]|uniref:FAR1 domain-containing protein n=1 Tax=Apophysomyces ossiformis TaxID=679940 RepID=A0A8H7BIF2_9FUNG|nr:hypothetical protein EC973_006875 [Apophysomyces ossiformis]
MISLLNAQFDNHFDLLDAVQQRAKESGFAVAIKNSNLQKGTVYIQCVHGQQYKNTHQLTDSECLKSRCTIKTGCAWVMYASVPKKTGKWTVKKISPLENHNHDMDEHAGLSYHQH